MLVGQWDHTGWESAVRGPQSECESEHTRKEVLKKQFVVNA